MSSTPKGIGWRVVVGTCLTGLAVACGGGSDPVGLTGIPLTTSTFAGWTGTYLAKFEVTGEMLTPTNTLEPITGTLEFADQAGTSTSPTSLLTGVDRLITWTLSVGGTPIEKLIWISLQDGMNVTIPVEASFGLYDKDWNLKPAGQVVKDQASKPW